MPPPPKGQAIRTAQAGGSPQRASTNATSPERAGYSTAQAGGLLSLLAMMLLSVPLESRPITSYKVGSHQSKY